MDINMVLGFVVLFCFFPSLMPAAFRSGKKVKKWPSSGQKRLKKRASGNRKKEML